MKKRRRPLDLIVVFPTTPKTIVFSKFGRAPETGDVLEFRLAGGKCNGWWRVWDFADGIAVLVRRPLFRVTRMGVPLKRRAGR